jgi:hypothetical protein
MGGEAFEDRDEIRHLVCLREGQGRVEEEVRVGGGDPGQDRRTVDASCLQVMGAGLGQEGLGLGFVGGLGRLGLEALGPALMDLGGMVDVGDGGCREALKGRLQIEGPRIVFGVPPILGQQLQFPREDGFAHPGRVRQTLEADSLHRGGVGLVQGRRLALPEAAGDMDQGRPPEGRPRGPHAAIGRLGLRETSQGFEHLSFGEGSLVG